MGRFSVSRPLRSVGRSRRSRTSVRRSLRPRSLCRGDERVHFSPSRTSRPVGCRPKDRGGDRVAPSGCFRSDPRLPACSPDGIVVARGRELNSRPARRKCLRISGGRLGTRASTPPDPFDCWRRCPRTDSVIRPSATL